MENKKVELDPFCMSDCTERINKALEILYIGKERLVQPHYAVEGTHYAIAKAINEAIAALQDEK